MKIRMARRTAVMAPSALREMLKVTQRPGVIAMAGGHPSASTFPVERLREACARLLAEGSAEARTALQYGPSEGYQPLREWVAAELGRKQGMAVTADQVLITAGSQQGLDLVGKILIDPGSSVLVEAPTYLGALQAFTPMEPVFRGIALDAEGPDPDALEAAVAAAAGDARFAYLLPNFQNPSGVSASASRRDALAERARRLALPLVEDNPYGDLWFDGPPPTSLFSRFPEGTVYLGSFSKVLVPGLRLGYLVAPPTLFPKFLQAKQAADLHTPTFNQRLVHDVIADGFLDRHVPTIRDLYRGRRDAMLAALARHMPEGVTWTRPAGGMFLWLELPEGLDAATLLAPAVERGVAFVPGGPFYAGTPARTATIRLSFVAAGADDIARGIEALAGLIAERLDAAPTGA